MFLRLFEESELLGNKKWVKYIFLRNTLYRSFDRALAEMWQGEWQRGFLILKQIADFSKIPWRLPYFSYLKPKYKIKSWSEQCL
jgi:hypothetical protein